MFTTNNNSAFDPSLSSNIIGICFVILSSVLFFFQNIIPIPSFCNGSSNRFLSISFAVATCISFSTLIYLEKTIFPPSFSLLFLLSILGPICSFFIISLSSLLGKHHYIEKSAITNFLSILSVPTALIIDYLMQLSLISIPIFLASIFITFALHSLSSSESIASLAISDSILPVSYFEKYGKRSGVLAHIFGHSNSRKIAIFLILNFSFMFVEALYGYWTNSLGLISDAGHMLFDCTALGIGLIASYIATLTPHSSYTFGYGQLEVIAGFANGFFLLILALHFMHESINRILKTAHISTDKLLLVSWLGLIVNIVGLVFFHEASHSHHDHSDHEGHEHHEHSEHINPNMLGIYLHVLADTLGSVSVIVSSYLVYYFEWFLQFNHNLIVLGTLPMLYALYSFQLSLELVLVSLSTSSNSREDLSST